MRVTIYYETVPAFDPQRAIDDLTYVLSRYGRSQAFLRIGGRPVVFVYGRAIVPFVFCATESCPPNPPTLIDWKPILDAVRARFHVRVFADRLSTILDLTPTLAAMGFDGVHEYNPLFDLSRGQTAAAIDTDIVSSAHRSDVLAAATVIPGYDDSHIGRAHPQVLDRGGGAVYRTMWEAAERSRPDLYLVTSFNEWHEGTEIEPSHEHGTTYLELTRALRP